jgi:hypothetical protein
MMTLTLQCLLHAGDLLQLYSGLDHVRKGGKQVLDALREAKKQAAAAADVVSR